MLGIESSLAHTKLTPYRCIIFAPDPQVFNHFNICVKSATFLITASSGSTLTGKRVNENQKQ